MNAEPQISFITVFSRFDPEIRRTLETYIEEITSLPYSAELVIVNDGLGDEVASELAAAAGSAPLHTRVLNLHRPAGEATSLSIASREARGAILVFLPPYLQVDPADIRPMVEEIIEGRLDYVASWRSPRVDSASARRKSEFFNWLTRRATGIRLHDINSGLRAMRREVVEEVPVYGDLYRFLPVLAAMQGWRVGEIKVRHLTERVQKGDYRLGVYLRRLLDLLTLFFLIKFTRKPLRFFGLLGSGVAAAGFGVLCVLTVERVFFGHPLADRPLLVLGVLLLVLGAQLFSIGLLGELIIFTHARDLNEYKIEKVFESGAEEPREPPHERVGTEEPVASTAEEDGTRGPS